MARPTPFKIVVSDEDLSWITERVKTTRLPLGKELPAGKEWSHGLPLNTASRLYQFWTNKYDWRKVEARINAELEMYTVPISHGDEQLTVHFAHHVSPHSNAIPLLFIHGWPGNFLEVAPMIRELTHPSSDSEQAYHVVAPSLPGYCFSSYPNKEFGVADMATTLNNLMLALGYDRYIAQGGDWGSIISRVLALDHATHCAGIHLYMMIAGLPSAAWAPLSLARLVFSYATGWWSEYDGRRIARMKWWMDEENGYRAIQGTKPQTLSYALTDSPFGMMCWIRDKLEHLVDDDFVWEDELVITWAMVCHLCVACHGFMGLHLQAVRSQRHTWTC